MKFTTSHHNDAHAEIASRREIFRMLDKLSLVFRKQLDQKTKELYYEALKGYSIRRISLALKTMVETRQSPFFPVPGEIIQHIHALPKDSTLRDELPPISREEAKQWMGYFNLAAKFIRMHKDTKWESDEQMQKALDEFMLAMLPQGHKMRPYHGGSSVPPSPPPDILLDDNGNTIPLGRFEPSDANERLDDQIAADGGLDVLDDLHRP